MRRKEKHIANGALVGAGLVVLADIFMQWREHKEENKEFTWDSYDGWRTIKRGALGGLVGGAIGYGVYLYKISEEEKIPFNSDEFLKKVLTEESLKADPNLLQKVLKYREDVKQWLVNVYGDKLVAPPENTGSFHKRTAINSNYDLDIVLPFKNTAYNTLEDMYVNVFEKISSRFSSVALVTKQTKAVGLTFTEGSRIVHFDIVPGREINDYINDKDLNLYVRPDWAWQKGGSFKTNIDIQKQLTVNKPEARKIIKLFKVYRDKNGFPLPTIIVDQLVVEAFEKSNFDWSRSETDNLLYSMEFIAKKLKNQALIDFANTNNNLAEKLTSSQRTYTCDQLIRDLERIEENPRYIKEIFES